MRLRRRLALLLCLTLALFAVGAAVHAVQHLGCAHSRLLTRHSPCEEAHAPCTVCEQILLVLGKMHRLLPAAALTAAGAALGLHLFSFTGRWEAARHPTPVSLKVKMTD